mmetsp:Transcript_32230/g.50432  ORF Transcript_32230/g.50432 Transcript_32230/m.50432 type:complete len:300 (-) Transcript_32230:109-1008(-)
MGGETKGNGKDGFLMTFEKVFRLCSVVVWWMITIPLIYICVPLRLFSFLLRALSVPNEYLPLDLLGRLQALGTIFLCGITAEVVDHRGEDKNQKGDSVIVMANHVSFLDPMVMTAYSEGSPKFIMKKELLKNPIGFMCWLMGHIPIDRSNREKAIKSINHAMKKIKRDQRSIVIFPEGTRSANGKLQAFKKGGFHMASDAGVSIQPVIVCNAYELLPRRQKLPYPGKTRIHLLPIVKVEKGEDVNELLEKVHSTMLEAQQKFEEERPPQQSFFVRIPFGPTIVLGVAGFSLFKLIRWFF